MSILLLGMGQSMRGDDAAGLEAIRVWQAQHPESASKVRVEFSELPGLSLLELMDGMDAAVLVDAVRTSAPAGKILRLRPDELASFTPEAGFVHGWGVAETIQMGKLLYASLKKCRITLIGIVGKNFNIGEGLSIEVREALGKAADMVELEIRNALKY